MTHKRETLSLWQILTVSHKHTTGKMSGAVIPSLAEVSVSALALAWRTRGLFSLQRAVVAPRIHIHYGWKKRSGGDVSESGVAQVAA